jgi:myxalamid-type nonribosomal peptide synthetase MxaA
MMNKNVDTIGYLTPLQHGMLHHSQREPASGLYVEQFSCVLEGPLDEQRFERAWQSVVQRHDVLKTLFIRLHEERPMQVVRRQVTLPFVRENWHGAADPDERFEALLCEDRARGFDPSVAPLMRIRLIDLGDGRHRFLWTYHHAILDGWSMPVLLGEVFRLYAGAPALPPPASDYRRYVAWLRKQDMAAVRAFWSEQLAGMRRPLRFAASMAPQDRAPSARRLVTVAGAMPEGWPDAALSWCRAGRITLNTLCQGAWSGLLALYGDSDDIVHGMVVSGRSPEVAGVETMVGLFINTLPVRVRLDAGQDLVEWLRHLQSQTLEIERHAHSPLAEVLQCAELPRAQPLFESIYVFENYPGQAAFRDMVAGAGLKVGALRAVEATNYPLALIVLPAKGLDFHLTFDTACFTEAAMARMLAQYRALLERIVAGEVRRVQDLRLDGAQQIVGTRRPEAAGESLLALVARHAALHPRQVAFEGRTSRLDYRELVDDAVQALRQWEAWGCQPGDRVLLCCHDHAAGLALLLAGLAHGIDCVLPDADADLAALLAAGPAAWGREGLRACVWTGPGSIDAPRLRCDMFDPVDAASLTADGPGAHEPGRGGCSLLRLGADGEWTLLRHDHSQLLQAAEACPVVEARDVALAHAPLSHVTIWTTLLGLGCGLSLRQVGDEGDLDLLCAAAAGDVHWHSIRLDPVASRQLGAMSSARWCTRRHGRSIIAWSMHSPRRPKACAG